MEPPVQQRARLVAALEDLADQEAACVHCGDFESVTDIQSRAAPVVEALAALSSLPVDSELRRRLAALVERRSKTAAQIEVHLTRTKEQLNALDASQRRAARMVPAYGGKSMVRGRLAAQG